MGVGVVSVKTALKPKTEAMQAHTGRHAGLICAKSMTSRCFYLSHCPRVASSCQNPTGLHPLASLCVIHFFNGLFVQ